MKTTEEIMRREWEYPSYPYRAIDMDGGDCYYKRKPDNYYVMWFSRFFVKPLIQKIDKDWAYVNWEKTLQSFEGYQKLILK